MEPDGPTAVRAMPLLNQELQKLQKMLVVHASLPKSCSYWVKGEADVRPSVTPSFPQADNTNQIKCFHTVDQGCSHFFNPRATYKMTKSKLSTYGYK